MQDRYCMLLSSLARMSAALPYSYLYICAYNTYTVHRKLLQYIPLTLPDAIHATPFPWCRARSHACHPTGDMVVHSDLYSVASTFCMSVVDVCCPSWEAFGITGMMKWCLLHGIVHGSAGKWKNSLMRLLQATPQLNNVTVGLIQQL